eukprot:gene4177-6523_t
MSTNENQGMFEDAEEDVNISLSEQLKLTNVQPSQIVSNAPSGVYTHSLSEHATYFEGDSQAYSDDDGNDDDDIYDNALDDLEDISSRGNLTKMYQTWNQNPNAQRKKQTNTEGIRQANRRICVEAYNGPKLKDSAANRLMKANKKIDANRIRTTDKADRATTELVLDPRTRKMLVTLISREIVNEIHGCISTGKEANVYYATTQGDQDYAIKIYKTSILVFKDRDQYVSGEFRFRHGYCKHNPRKMVKTWAEKEYRNLFRLNSGGVPCPKPIVLKSHIIVMEFLGKDGWPSPRLKDAEITQDKAHDLYYECALLMRKMYCTCRLVHGDLSEYNILYHNCGLVIIDVSQSVEHDHPNSKEFLRRDIKNINEYFSNKLKVETLSNKDLFELITDPLITDENIDSCIDAMKIRAAERRAQVAANPERAAEFEVNDRVFQQVFIPSSLEEMPVRDLRRAAAGETAQMHFQSLTGMREDLSGARIQPAVLDWMQNRTGPHEHNTTKDGSHLNQNEDNSSTEKSQSILENSLSVQSLPPNLESQKIGSPEPSHTVNQSDAHTSNQDDGEDSDCNVSHSRSERGSNNDMNSDDADVNISDEDADEGGDDIWQIPGKIPDLTGLSKAERKRIVKEFNRDRRANKTPKHVKKRKKTLAQRRKGK